MANVFVEDYLQKLGLLETRVGSVVGYKILEPFEVNPHDPVGLNSAARKIADFTGIRKLVVVATTQHNVGTAGHIELQPNAKEVYIEVANNLLDFSHAVLATLAHEISHEFLHSVNISCGLGAEHHYHNEVLTDITAIFLGLGKIMLNGAESSRAHSEWRGEKRVEVTENRKVGYLDRDQMAFVYRLVRAMRRIPGRAYELGLTPEALVSVHRLEDLYGYSHFDVRFHLDQTIEKEISDLRQAVEGAHRGLEQLRSEVSCFKASFVNPIDRFVVEATEQIALLAEEASKNLHGQEFDPALRFLQRLQSEAALCRYKEVVGKYCSELALHRKKLASLREAPIVGHEGVNETEPSKWKIRGLLKRVFDKDP